MTNERELRGLMAWLNAPQGTVPWRWAQVGLVFAVLALSMILIASTVALSLAGVNDVAQQSDLLIGWAIGFVITGAFVLIRWRRHAEDFAALRLGSSRLHLALMVMIGVGIALTASLAAGLGSGNFGAVAPVRGLALDNLGALLLAGVFLIGVQPLVETLIFFGILLPTLRGAMGPWPGLLTTSIGFAGFHLLIYGTALAANLPLWYGFVLPLVLGLGLAMVRVWANSTRAAAVAYIGAGITFLLISATTG